MTAAAAVAEEIGNDALLRSDVVGSLTVAAPRRVVEFNPVPPNVLVVPPSLGLSANAAGGLLNLKLAHRTAGGSPTSEPSPRTRVLLQGGWVF